MRSPLFSVWTFDDATTRCRTYCYWGIYGDMVVQRIIGLLNRMLTVRLCLCGCRDGHQRGDGVRSLCSYQRRGIVDYWARKFRVCDLAKAPSSESSLNLHLAKARQSSLSCNSGEKSFQWILGKFFFSTKAPASTASRAFRTKLHPESFRTKLYHSWKSVGASQFCDVVGVIVVTEKRVNSNRGRAEVN